MLKGRCANMMHPDLTGSGPRQKKRSAAPASKRRPNGPRKRGTPPEKKVEPTPPAPVGRLERTRRLILAALRLWELRRHIRD